MKNVFEVATGFWLGLTEMAPYLLFGFLVAGLLSLVLTPAFVERHLGGRGASPVFKAALLGVPLPLCSCGVIPVAASLHKHGSSRGATTAFMLSTPQTGVDSIMVTYAMLGPVFAVFRPVAALLTGVIGGLLSNLFDPYSKADGGPSTRPVCEDECCSPSNAEQSRLGRVIRYGFISLPRDIGRPMLVGLLVAGCIQAFVPSNLVELAVGSGLGAMLIMMAVGVPLYVCATASVPIAAAMLAKGASPGAVFVFLVTGPATNSATIATLWHLLGRRTTIIYLVTLAGLSLLFGALLNSLALSITVNTPHGSHVHIPSVLMHASAVILMLLLMPSLLPRKRPSDTTEVTAAMGECMAEAQGACPHCKLGHRR